MLSPEKIEDIKKQLIQQIEENFPDDKKDFAKQQVEAMNSEQLENFLVQNNLIKNDFPTSQGQHIIPASQGRAGGETSRCIFCSIAEDKIPSYKIDENKSAVAVLEINPISRGHSLIIPKKHLPSGKKIPKNILTLAEKISKKIKTKLKPKNIEISPSSLFGHEILNVLPVYKDENLNSQRKQAGKEELEELQEILKKKQKAKTIKKPRTKIIDETKIRLPRRIP